MENFLLNAFFVLINEHKSKIKVYGYYKIEFKKDKN